MIQTFVSNIDKVLWVEILSHIGTHIITVPVDVLTSHRLLPTMRLVVFPVKAIEKFITTLST
jgi:hypothetical protein